MADSVQGRDTAPPAETQASGRLLWIDTARGITMILVVLLHADVVAEQSGWQVLPVTLFDYALFPLRMPTFFLVSGVLAAGLLRRPAGEVLRRRVLHYAWLYSLWSLLYAGFHVWAFPHLGPPAMQAYYTNIEHPLQALVVTWNNVWFLYALMLFFALALALRRLPPAVQMAIALALAVPGAALWGREIGLPVIERFYHFPYFMLGILASARLKDRVPRLGRAWMLLPLGLVWAMLTASAHMDRILRDPWVIAALSVLAVPLGLGVAAFLAARLPLLAVPLQVIGRNTLVIYVLHTMALRTLLALLPAPGWMPGVVYLPVMALLALLGALAAGKLLARIPGLFGLPRFGRAPAEKLARA